MAEKPPSPGPACPICGRDTVPALRPFCSRRCADVDLGRWFSGHYRTPLLRPDLDEDDDNPASGAEGDRVPRA